MRKYNTFLKPGLTVFGVAGTGPRMHTCSSCLGTGAAAAHLSCEHSCPHHSRQHHAFLWHQIRKSAPQ